VDRLLVSVEEAAELLGVGRSTVYDLMRTHVLPSMRIGRCRRIPMDALRDYIHQLQATPYDPGRTPALGLLRRGVR
jgi:excisionase family DNA binding protein